MATKATLDDIYKLFYELKAENKKFKEDIQAFTAETSNKVESKHLPIYLEKDILSTAQQAISKSISDALSGYNSPIGKLVNLVVDQNSAELRGLISDAFTKVIRTEEFKQSIVSAFSHKIAKTIISNNDGLFDRVSNELKQDATFKSKMVLAVSNVVEECLKG